MNNEKEFIDKEIKECINIIINPDTSKEKIEQQKSLFIDKIIKQFRKSNNINEDEEQYEY